MLKSKINIIISSIALGVLIAGCIFLNTDPARAAVGINETINFQAKLVNTDSTNVSNGTYNMEFKIYQDGDGVPGGGDETLKWTESRLRNNSQGVVVTDGVFQINLGSVTAFGTSVDWNQTVLWLSINIGDTSPSCTPFSSCSPDGEMNPMVRFTSTPYALNAGQLGGLNKTNFVQLAQGVQTDASTSNPSIYINKTGSTANILHLQRGGADVLTISNAGAAVFKNQTNSTTAFQIQNAAGTTTVFNANTTNGRVGIGNAAPSVALDVTGAGKFSTTLDVDGTAAFGNTTPFGLSVLEVNHAVSGACAFGCYGISSFLTVDPSSGGDAATALYTKMNTSAIAQALDSAYSILADNPSLGTDSSITNNYGIRVVAQTAGTNDYGIALEAADTQTLWVSSNANNTTAAAGIAFGSSRDTNLYRSAANTLKTDDSLIVGTDFTANGTALFKNSSDSTTAFQIQNAAGSGLFIVDTSGLKVIIGSASADSTGVILVLDTKNTSGDPTGTNGAIYYNSYYHSNRCYRGINSTDSDGKWELCSGFPAERGYEIYEEFMFGSTGSTSATIGKNNWNAQTINSSACQTLAYDVLTAVDRPGVLRQRTNGTGTSGGCAIQLGGSSNMVINSLAANQVIKMAVAVGGTSSTSQIFKVGIHNAGNGTTAPTAGIWWEADPSANANWQYCYANASTTAVCSASSTAIAADTFVSLEIRVLSTGASSSSADFFINGTKHSVSGSISFNVSSSISPNLWCKAINATAQNCYTDYFVLQGLTSDRR